MTGRTEIERALDGFLAEGPDKVADPAFQRALDAIDRTPQRRGLAAPWRFSLMITLPRLAATVLVAVIALGGAVYFLGPWSSVGGPASSPTASPASSLAGVTPLPTSNKHMPLDTTTWTPFTTSRYGYTVAWPADAAWIHSPATEDWAGQSAAEMWDSPTEAPWVDKFYDQVTQLTMTAVATTIPVGTTVEAFIDAYLKPAAGTTDTCVELAKDMPTTTIDGHPARETTKCSNQAGFVAIGRRLYVFSISNQNEVPFLNAYLSTVRLPTPS